MGMKSSGGEIVQVQGGHIVRSTGRKDRHSKVFTAKGPRDRRVRLSAQTAIQFYDVQDRLGYDRPSKAVDWLIKKAKSAIDKLEELPPWNPTAEQLQQGQNGGSSEMAMAEQSEFQRQLGENPDTHSGFLPPPIDAADAIAFFPTSSGTSSINFQNYPSGIISRTTHSTEDLGLSLHSLAANQTPSNDQTLFAGSNAVEFESNYPRMVTWNNDASTDMNRAGFMMNSQPLLFQGSAFPQRGTLQSSFSPLVHHNHKSQQPVHQASIFGGRFVSDGLPEFCIPVRIHGEQEENHGVASHKPSS